MAKDIARARQARNVKSKARLNTYYSSGQPAGAANSPLNKRRLMRGRLAGWLGRLLEITIVLGLAALLTYSLILNPAPRIIVNDTSYHQVDIYQKEANKQFQNLKNKNKVTLDEQGIAASMKKQFPEIVGVSIQLPLLGKTPKIIVTVSKPTLYIQSHGKLLVVDEKGRAVALAEDLPQVQGLSMIEDQSGFDVQIGQQVLNASEVSFITSLVNQGKKVGITPSSLTLPQKVQELVLKTDDQPYAVKFFLGGDPAIQIGQWLAARTQFSKDGTVLGEYLDVRVQGKIYYK